jgi:acetolactate synthase-1/3 small subunit
VDVALKSFIIEVTGKEAKVNALVELLRPYGLVEMVRTGEVAIFRGKRVEEAEERHVKVKEGRAGQANL